MQEVEPEMAYPKDKEKKGYFLGQCLFFFCYSSLISLSLSLSILSIISFNAPLNTLEIGHFVCVTFILIYS